MHCIKTAATCRRNCIGRELSINATKFVGKNHYSCTFSQMARHVALRQAHYKAVFEAFIYDDLVHARQQMAWWTSYPSKNQGEHTDDTPLGDQKNICCSAYF